MTREEAAQLLWRVAYDKYGLDDNPMRQREAADIVVTALRGPDTGCPECSWIELALSDCNYCKNCGRRLRED